MHVSTLLHLYGTQSLCEKQRSRAVVWGRHEHIKVNLLHLSQGDQNHLPEVSAHTWHRTADIEKWNKEKKITNSWAGFGLDSDLSLRHRFLTSG